MTTYLYNSRGNPTTYNSLSATYDPADRLSWIGSGGTPTVQAGYDSGGLRAWKQAGSGSPTYYLYDGADPVEEMTGSGTSPTVAALNTFGADGLVSRNSGGASTFYEFDPMGNVAHRLGSTGALSNSDVYDAWGNALVSGSSTDPFGYGAQAGYFTDHESGLLLLGHRYYDPARGRFLNRDPIGYDGGDNLYGYVGDDPTTWMDPDGLSGIGAIGATVKGVGVGIRKGLKFHRPGNPTFGDTGTGLKFIGRRPPGTRGGARTFHVDVPHPKLDIPYYHINADIGPLSNLGDRPGHIRISEGMYFGKVTFDEERMKK